MLWALSAGLLGLLSAGAAVYGQGVQAGTLTGMVRDAGGLVLPGVTVTVASPALQGLRTAVTDGNGVFTVPGLPPGPYTVRFELSGMKEVTTTQRIDLGLTARLDIEMSITAFSEVVIVAGETSTLVTTATGGANYRSEMLDTLAAPRTVQGIAELAPGLTDYAPDALRGQVTISGGFAYDNQFLIDGVDVADNLFGTANNLFIEDAVEEVQVLTSGISAEYGRFSGGVVNAVTRSGGNRFTGSVRDNTYKPSWTVPTPYEKERNLPRTGDLQHVYEWTIGGPIRRDRLWFFHAGRSQSTTTPAPFPQTGIANSNFAENTRFEIKATATLAKAQTFQGQYLRNPTTESRPSTASSIDPSTVADRIQPNTLWAASWRGVLNDRMFATVQASRRGFEVRSGGTSTRILDSPFVTRNFTPGVPLGAQYNAPYFDANDPEDRDNAQITGSLSAVLTTKSLGTHDLKVGFERFVTTRAGGNSQSATDYVFQTDYLLNGTQPALDSSQKPIPVFRPGLSRVQNWVAARGANIDITTQSLYIQDRWAVRPRLSLDVGMRAEFVRSEATGDIVGVETSTIVPRLGASYDALGDATTTLQVTYARYGGKYSEAQIGRNTPVGTPNLLTYEYTGPAGQGLGFAPAFDLTNYRLIGGSFPLATVVMDEGLRAPTSDEFTASIGRQLGSMGAVKAAYQRRRVSGVIESFIDDPSASGKVTVIQNGVTLGTFDKTFWRNTDEPIRRYQAMIVQGNYRFTPRWTAEAHWTLQIENHGNFEGELPSNPGSPSPIGDYPEIFGAWARQNPEGRLDDFQRHKVRAWTTYGIDLGRAGTIDASVIFGYNSARSYSLRALGAQTSAVQLGRNPGYALPPVSQALYFDERGSEFFEASRPVGLGLLYQVPVWTTLRPWLKFEVYNLFNGQPLVNYNTAITPDASSPRDADGLATAYLKGASFGRATGNDSYSRAVTTPGGAAQYARTVLLSFGLRF